MPAPDQRPPAAACPIPETDGVPTCETSPAGRFKFVLQELREIFRELRRRKAMP